MRTYLTKGYVLRGDYSNSYTIQKKIGEGGSCIAYSAKLDSTGNDCIIKEYYPLSMNISRTENGTLICSDIEMDKYKAGVERFCSSIEKQIKLRLIDTTRNQTFYIMDRFFGNNTYYVVVPMFGGCTFQKAFNLSLYDRIRVCKSVSDYVNRCHRLGYLCLDIKPDNIFVIPETPELPMFFDFDSVCMKSDIVVGNVSTYYTESWAAPEQLLPGSYKKISERTDVYILGELVFWSVFGRHSTEEEHRIRSQYNFKTSEFSLEINNKAERLLEEIFHNTLRSAPRNRYSSVDMLNERLDDLTVLLSPRKESIINILPLFTQYFIGREKELSAVSDRLKEGHKAILVGIGGIGKSEIAKQYVQKHKEEYRSVIYLTYSFDIVSTINNSDFITEFEQKEGESDVHYCNRKISKLGELYNGKDLLIIDSFNYEFEGIKDVAHKEIWRRILSLNCDLILTTRCIQEAFSNHQIYVEELDYENLSTIFANYCHYGEDQSDAVKKIMSAVNGLTLVVELIAKQANASQKTPSEMYQLLNEKGILGLNSEIVKLDLNRGTVSEHIRGMFSVSGMTVEQKKVILKVAFMPIAGVEERMFCDYYQIDNHTEIRYLTDNGWINTTQESDRIITMHPVIRTIVIDELCRDVELANDVFVESRYAMSSCYARIWKHQDVHYIICRSVAMQIYDFKVNVEKAADFLEQYVNLYDRYGNTDERISLIEKAIEIYDFYYDKDKYVAVREKAYDYKIGLINDVNHYDKVKKECKEHLRKARKNKDLYMKARWYIRLNEAAHVRNSMVEGFSLMTAVYPTVIGCIFNRILKESKKKRNLLSNEKLQSLNYGYMARWNLPDVLYNDLAQVWEHNSGNDIFFTKKFWLETYSLNMAVKIRNRDKSAQSVSIYSNSIYKIIDLAKLDILDREYDKAFHRLEEIVNFFDERKIPENADIYAVRDMIGTIALTVGDYERAIKEYNKCLEIASDLNYKKNYGIRVGLAQAYVLSGDLCKSKEVNISLKRDLKEVDEDNRSTFFAEMYYNAGYRYLLADDYEKAEKHFKRSREQFRACDFISNRRDVGLARTRFQLGKLKFDTAPETSASYVQKAYNSFKSCLGEKHKETIECKEMLERCKPYLKR